MKIRTNSGQSVYTDKFRNFRESLFAFWRTGLLIRVIEVPEDPEFYAKFKCGPEMRATIYMSDDIDPDQRGEFLMHECIHANIAILQSRGKMPDRILSEAVSVVADLDQGKHQSGYSQDAWPVEALTRIATDWHFHRAIFRNLEISNEMRRMLWRLTIPLSGIAHRLPVAITILAGAILLS